ncbi:hypothetical protein ACE193_24290 [Bernardetia sp. OM2101]|uniref:hypothetical protein n=1 Tax=Bernardetia sp. OM2101 TaxID=3344876 RepID=UPI0035CFB4C6
MKNLHLYILYFIAFLLLNACTSNSSESTEKLELVPYFYKNELNIFAKDGKWGFMDRDKNVVVHASYEYVQRFYRGDSLFNFTFGSVGDSEYELIDNNGNILEKDIIKREDVFFQKDTKEWFYRYKNENILLEGKVPKKYIGNKIILHDSIKNIDYLASALPINEIEIAKNHERINKLYAIKVENIKHSKNTIFYENKLAIIKYKNILYEITPTKITEVVEYLGKEDKFLTIKEPTSFIYIDKSISQKMPSTTVYSRLGFFIDYKKDSSFIYDEEGNYFDKHKGKVKDVIQYKNKTLPIYHKDSVDGLSIKLPTNKEILRNIRSIHNYNDVVHIEFVDSAIIVTKNTIINNLSHSFREQTLFGFIKKNIPDSIYFIPYGRKISIAVPTYMEVAISDTLTEKQELWYSATIKNDVFFYRCPAKQEFSFQDYKTKKVETIKGVVSSLGFSEGFAFLKKENEMLKINEKGDIVN